MSSSPPPSPSPPTTTSIIDTSDAENPEQTTTLDMLLTLRQPEPEGTWGMPAFQMFVGATPGCFSALGFHCHPHVGVYGDDFTPCFPMVAISLPPSRALLNAALGDGGTNHVATDGEENGQSVFDQHVAPHLIAAAAATGAEIDPVVSNRVVLQRRACALDAIVELRCCKRMPVK